MSESRRFNVIFEKVAVSAAQDLFTLISPASLYAIRLINLLITQDSDEGDAQAEMLNILIHKGTTTGSGGSAATPVGLNHSKSYGGSARVNDTSQGTEGAKIWTSSFNIMTGLDKFWHEDERFTAENGERLIVELQDAPNDELTMSGVLTFEEMRGI